MLVKDQAICIRALDYSESSQILTWFTRTRGKVATIAKGAKRAKSSFDGPIERFSRGTVVYRDAPDQQLMTLTEFQQCYGAATGVTRDLLTYHAALLATELLTKLTHEHDPHPELYDDYLAFLQNIGDTPGEKTSHCRVFCFLILFQLSLLKHAGLSPVLSRCVNCGAGSVDRWEAAFLSPAMNGLVCRDCEMAFPERIQLSQTGAGCLARPARLSGSPESTLRDVEHILIEYFTYVLHHEPKSAKFVLEQS